MFNGSRFIDDIGLAGVPACILYGRFVQGSAISGGSDGIYPTSISGSDGTAVDNPMELKLESSGLSTHY